MFNHSEGQSRAPQYNDDHDPFAAFGHQLWPNSSASSSSMRPAQHMSHHQPGRSFTGATDDGGGSMDWTPVPDMHTQYQHAGGPSGHDIQLHDPDTSPGLGVGRLVAHFENKSFVPPLPPRPIPVQQHHPNQQQHHMQMHNIATSTPQTMQFGSFNTSDMDRGASPIESQYGSFDFQSRVGSPIATSPPAMNFGSFHDGSRVSSPIGGPSTTQFGSLDDFMSGNRMNSPMVASPVVASPAQSMPGVGTPGFQIWRPPAAITQKEVPPPPQHQFNNSNPPASSGNFFKPPVPSTPKPVMNAGSQFILELNPTAKGKAKAAAKPPKPKVPPPLPTSPKPEPGLKREPDELVQVSSPLTATNLTPSSLRTPAASRASREQVPAEAWEQFKTTIRSLYLEERKPLKEVMSIMAEKYNFQATPKMYKTRFSQWGFVKNNTEDEVKRLLSMKFQRDAEGKVSEFVRNGRVVNLGTYLKRKGVTEYDLVDFELPADLPSHVRCRTPTPPPAPDYLRSPDLIRAQELVVGNIRKAFLHCRQFEIETDTQISWASNMVWGAISSDLLLEANFYFEARDTDQGGVFLMRAFKQLEMDLKTLSPPGITELLLGMVHRDVGLMTALCKYLAAYSTTNLDRSHPLRQIFTCLYEVQQKHGAATLSDLLWASIPTIAEELEAIYGRRHPYVARLWIDMAMFYSHLDPERLDKLVPELRIVLRQVEQEQGSQTVDAMVVRYSIAQLLYSISPESDAMKQIAHEIYNIFKSLGLLHVVRDPRPDVYCYHSPLRLDPWTKRCRRRYDFLSVMIEKYVGAKVHVYFEEDPHIIDHEPDPQDAWAAAMDQMSSRWGGGYI
ncbi:hypothetical protein B0I35DRAFT_482264 [Stachybotrys elegans]|uniref:Clr5 domain-containing protein n=1 Tax=Stachybotrys elegans TaxID=80388 RepID=A0A8K0WMX9_9HYPO|nr:hypothetical protein B0I35DRAFT_482264 [Stachybotrys elegans]